LLCTIAGERFSRHSLAVSSDVSVPVLAVETLLVIVRGRIGISMFLIRFMLPANGWRIQKTHLMVFFMFLAISAEGGDSLL